MSLCLGSRRCYVIHASRAVFLGSECSHTFLPHTHQREGSHVVDFEGVLRPVLLAVVILQCGCRRVIAL